MASIAAGNYHIVNAANPAVALDVSGAGTTNGSNVQVYYRNHTDAQVWTVQYRPDETARVLSRWCGKCLDLAGFIVTQGQNVQLYSDNDTRAQQWEFVETGRTLTIDGTSYPTYFIQLVGFDGAWVVECEGTGTPPAGRNICVAGNERTSLDQHWAFVPIDLYHDGGLYEILSLMDTRTALDVAGGVATDGANMQLYTRNTTNAQKFILEKSGEHWMIRTLTGGKYVRAVKLESLANVEQNSSTGDLAKWVITEFGTTRVDGVDCQVVRFGQKGNSNLVMDAAGAIARPNTNIFVHPINQGSNQSWILVPTSATDPYMPTPHTLGLARRVGDVANQNVGAKGTNGVLNTRFYPAWTCSDAWATDGSNHYEWRFRTRLMKSKTSTWASWSNWTSWETAAVTQSGTRAWVTDGVPFNYALSQYKSCEFEMEVRSAGEGTLALLTGAVAGVKCTIGYMPDIALSDASWTPEGLVIPCTCDYDKGRAKAYISSIKCDGKELISRPVSIDVTDGEIVIPQDCLMRVPSDNGNLIVTFAPGTDQVAIFPTTETQAITVSYGGSAQAPELVEGQGMSTIATAPSGARVWCVSDVLRECRVLSDDGVTATYEILYPFGVEYDLFMTSDEGTWHAHMDARTPNVHAWNWEGGTFVLECRNNDTLQTEYQLKADYEAYKLDARRREAVRVGRTFSGAFNAVGATIPGKTDSVHDDAVALQEAAHATYRSPNGWVRDVAITAVDLSIKHHFAEVSVSMIEEVR